MQIAYNKTKRSQKPIYIVVHDTGNSGKGANAMAHFNYFNGGDRSASADFFVDDSVALQVNDYHTYYTWHCGDGKGKNGITNSNSVGIEICINRDGDYDKAVKRAQALVKKLMEELNIPLSRVVRHYDASGKICPCSMSKNNWQAWQDFKAGLEMDDLTFVQKAAGLEDQTMTYLKNYTYGKDLLYKLAKAIKE
ncbi:MAG: N-acetylmuramoyl-L-alanine amidase [Clostridia bacterium]|nr:N-acetylmuramoyl-L-alanine amidase [Clostridia bacterium]